MSLYFDPHRGGYCLGSRPAPDGPALGHRWFAVTRATLASLLGLPADAILIYAGLDHLGDVIVTVESPSYPTAIPSETIP